MQMVDVVSTTMLSLLFSIPRHLAGVLLFITCFLLSFLLVGCTNTGGTYSKVFLTQYLFNQTSELYPNVKAAYHNDQLSQMSIKVGYLGLCVDFNSSSTCTSYNNINAITNVTGVLLIPTTSKSNSQLNLLLIGKTFNNNCHPRVLMTAIIISVILLVLKLYRMLPGVPGKTLILKCNFGLSMALVLLWGLGSMLQHEAVTIATKLVPPASMGLIKVKLGNRAEAMTWTAFSFILLVAISNFFDLIQVFKKVKQNEKV